MRIRVPFGAGAMLWASLVWLACGPAVALGGNPDGSLRIEIITAYNLVVDSNAGTPASYAPESAYLGAKFCNDGDAPLTNVWAYIGNYDAGTPGIYPSRAHPGLRGPLPGGEFALTHEGGAMGTDDATRYIGTIQPGECITVYWLVSYPQLDEDGVPTWGKSVKPDDDLWMEYDVWATAMDGPAYLEADTTRTLTCRNEISAAANKIWPNGANKVPQEYKDLLNQYAPLWTNTAATAEPGAILRTEGIWYDLGNVGHGFDNDGDLVPDRNAWLQPVGDPALFDPSCFRLIRTYAMVIIKLNDGTEQVIVVEDQLYFTNIPENNRGAVGYVMYEFIAIGSGCVSTLTPYQEVASGYDNEKFNGDYGATPGETLTSTTSQVAIVKAADPRMTRAGSNIAYTVTYTNTGTTAVGRPDLGLPLVVQDEIPPGTTYVAGSATANNELPDGVSSYTIYYSTNSGATWSMTEPAVAATVTDVQWWLSDPLEPGAAGTVRFTVRVDDPYLEPSPIVPNAAGLSMGNTAPFQWAFADTLIMGVNAIGDLVWRDDGEGGGMLGNLLQDGTEAGITGVTVRLYYDTTGNGVPDTLLATTNTGPNGLYLFDGLPDGYFVVQVDIFNENIPFGYTPTTPTSYSIALDPARTNANAVTNLTADFGFAPALTLTKTLTSTNAFREGQLATYEIDVANRLPGDGAGGGLPVEYTMWATNGTQTWIRWFNHTNAFIPSYPDGIYASNNFTGQSTETLFLTGYNTVTSSAAITDVTATFLLGRFGAVRAGDTVAIRVVVGGATIWGYTNLASAFVTGTYSTNVTHLRNWTWADLAGASLEIDATKGGGNAQGGNISVDQAGFHVMTDGVIGTGAGGNTTLNPVPLTDQFDADLFQFVSAEPPPTSLTIDGSPPDSVGNLYWSNIGPIYPGGTSTVAVTFKLLEPPDNADTAVTNFAWTTNAMFMSGLPANNQTGMVVNTLLPAGTIGDFVWRDLNGDGSQDPGEPGIPNVALTLTPPAGVDLGAGPGVAITNWTDAEGYYLFEFIPVTGTYTVRVVTATLPGGSGVNTFDEDGILDSTTAVYIDIYAPSGHTNNTHLTTDYGYMVGSTIEGTIWHDWNRGGEPYREPGENWLTNVTVYLCAGDSPCGEGGAIATNVTDANGYFQFVGDFDGTYTVTVATNTGMMSTGTWRLSFDTDGTNTANQVTVEVPSGGLGRADFSYFRTGPYRIGDTLFYDWDGNGVQDPATEEGIPNVTVRLYSHAAGDGVLVPSRDAFIAETVTDQNGLYVFTNLFATTTYLVVVDRNDPDLPPSYFITADPWGAMDGISVVTITNADDMDQDFGFQPYGSGAIGDTVWLDQNANGIQFGTLEPGIPNITVTLYADMSGSGTYVPLRSTTTDSKGWYLFDGLPDGHYRVVVDDADPDLPTDMYGNVHYPSTPTFYDITISGGSIHLDADFGFAPHGALGDTVFWDSVPDGTQDHNEIGIPDVTVHLFADLNGNRVYDPGEPLVDSTVTDATGWYLFDGLRPGDYVVVVDTDSPALAGAVQSADPDSDGLPCHDPDLLVPCDDQYGHHLHSGQIFYGADFGYVSPLGVIGDLLWVDTNNNGEQDEGEPGIPYVSVVLYSNGVAIATNETDANGIYLFSELADATYRVVVQTDDEDFPAGLVQSYDPDGTLDNQATDIVISGGSVVSIGGVACTDCDLAVDFGYRYAGTNSLSGTIGLDVEPYDGLMNGLNPSGPGPGETPYAGVSVYAYLWDDDGDGIVEAGEYVLLGSTQTDANGDYAFTNLPSGSVGSKYIVSSSAPEDQLKLTTTNGSIAGVTVVETRNAQGFTVSAYLTIAVAADITNMDFAYQTTRLYDYGDLPESYGTLLPDGARHVVPAVPNLYLGAAVDTEPNGLPSVGADGDDLDGVDDEDGVEPVVETIWRVGADGGAVEVTVGAGSGWLVGYIDFNRDGNFVDAGELIFSLPVSSTGGDGNGVYELPFPIPAETFSTTSSTPLYARFRLFPAEPLFPELAFSGTASNGEVEDYLWHFAGVGDRVWFDMNADGVQDEGEPPIPGVRVFLDLNDDGIWQAGEPYSITDENGLYGMGGLVPGEWSIVVDTSTLPAGVTPTYDLDGTNTPNQTMVAITEFDQFVDTADFGYAPPATIGKRVWFDENRDGIQNANETNGLANIPVRLIDLEGRVVATTQTDEDGYYLLTLVPPGTYVIQFDLASVSTNEIVTTAKVGEDDSIDSDAIMGWTGDVAWTAEFSVAPGETNLNQDLGVSTRTPTRAALAAVWGEWVEKEGRVTWRTDSEFTTAGFWVFRIDPETGEETRLNDRLVVSAFHEGGATYALSDPAAAEGQPGTYRLAEVELSGAMLELGTHEVRFDVPAAPAVVSRSALAAKPAVKSVRTKSVAGPSPVLKVQVEREGIFGVAWQAIADGMGLPLVDVQALAEAGTLQMTRQGQPVPVLADAARKRLVFHARQPVRTWYAHDDVYLILTGAGISMERRDPGAASGTSVFPATIRFEENRFLVNLNRMPDDFYFWIPVMSGYGELSVNPVPLDLSGYAGGDVALKVRLVGSSSSAKYPDHLARFEFNGIEVGEIAFDGQDLVEAELSIPASAVLADANVLTIEGVQPEGYDQSFFFVDWVEATFNRTLEPLPISAMFGPSGVSAVSAQAFSEPLAVAVDESGTPMWLADENGELPAKAWAVAGPNERYAVVEAEAVPLLAPEPAAADAWFLSADNQVDYLVIASRELAAPAQELVDYRAGQGLRTGLAVFGDVCDLMTGGVRTPEAIPALLRHAAATWAVSPRMVVLAGSGHYDYLGITYTEPNHLPPMLVQMPAGVCASDGLLADTGGDALPDVAIGRLPALTAADLTAMVDKIKAYELGIGSEWQSQLVLAADNADAAGQYLEANARLASLVEAPYSVVERIELDVMEFGQARTNLLDWFNAGAGFINYIGHGDIRNLAAEKLLQDADVAGMVNAERPPVTVMLTCLAARYEVPALHSLGERLMRRAGGGAVAVLGPSGLSQNAPALELGEAFYRVILQEGAGELGPAFLTARRSLPDSLFTKDTIAVYNLLGDPALRIADPETAQMPNVSAQVLLSGLEQVFDGAPRTVTAATDPAGLSVRITYDGRPDAPTEAGSYEVAASVNTVGFEGFATGTLTVAKATAQVFLGDLAHTYDGMPKRVSATTEPGGLTVAITYDGDLNSPTDAGTYDVVATVLDANHEGIATGELAIVPAPATIWLEGLEQEFDGAPRTVTATTEIEGVSVAVTYNGLPTPPASAGSYTVVASLADANHTGSMTGTLIIAKSEAEVVLGNLLQSFDGAPKPATAVTSPEELAVDFTYDGVRQAPVAAGTYEVIGTISDANWEGTAQGLLTIEKGEQAIEFAEIHDRRATEPVILSATASSGLPVSFAVREGPAVIEGNVLSFTGAGTVSVEASQTGDDNWQPAPDVVRTFMVSLLEISQTQVNVREGGEGRFFVRLLSEPIAAMDVHVNRQDGDPGIRIREGEILTFTPENWADGQAVILAADLDDNREDELATFRISSPGEPDAFVEAIALDIDHGINLARADGATIHGDGATNPEQVIDGIHQDVGNYGSVVWNQDPPGGMILDLGVTARVSRVRLLNWDFEPSGQRYRMETSRDAQKWTLLVDASDQDRSGWDDWHLDGMPVRYLRFTGLASSLGPEVRIAEWEIYGEWQEKVPATVLLDALSRVYSGHPKRARVETIPDGLALEVTYDGDVAPPVEIGEYEVMAIIQDATYAGSASGILSIVPAQALFELWLANGASQRPQGAGTDPELDPDQDGMSTWEEFLADTDPYDPDSVLALDGWYEIGEPGVQASQMRLTFPASTSRFYQLIYSTNLSSPAIVTNLGRGIAPEMTILRDAPGAWYGTIRVWLEDPDWP